MMTSPEPTIETFGALDIRVARITHAAMLEAVGEVIDPAAPTRSAVARFPLPWDW